MIIDVEKIRNNEFKVNVKSEIETIHFVNIRETWYLEKTEGKLCKKRLIELSFRFLLDREPNTSILEKFDLDLISHYFPEYINDIKDWCLRLS